MSEILKDKVKGIEGLGEDERVGRIITFELNKSYPVVLAPTLCKEELEVHFLKHLKAYVPSYSNLYESTNHVKSSKQVQIATVKEKSGILEFF